MESLDKLIGQQMNQPVGFEVNDVGIFAIFKPGPNPNVINQKLVMSKEVFIAAYRAYISGSGLGD